MQWALTRTSGSTSLALPHSRVAALLAEALADCATFEDAVDRLVEFAVQDLGTVHGGITRINARRKLETIGASHPDVLEADRRQYKLGEGPCVDAALSAKSLTSSNLTDDERWPRWGPEAASLGFHSIISVGLHARGEQIGSINLYGAERCAFNGDDLDTLKLIAVQAAPTLVFTRREQSLTKAIENRTLIGQAQGILMGRYGIDSDQAFAVLRRHSQDSNIRLHEIAQQIVDRRGLPESE